jgi:hypothetical protein
METQTFTVSLLLAALAASGLCVRSLAWFIYSGLPMSGERWSVRQVHMAPWPAIGLQLGQGAVVAVRSADVDLSVTFTHADPAMLPVPSDQAFVTL